MHNTYGAADYLVASSNSIIALAIIVLVAGVLTAYSISSNIN